MGENTIFSHVTFTQFYGICKLYLDCIPSIKGEILFDGNKQRSLMLFTIIITLIMLLLAIIGPRKTLDSLKYSDTI
jgi:hypothetical protein